MEIEFRAWGYHHLKEKYVMYSWRVINSYDMQYFWNDDKFKDRIIMQYIGLKDKNGVKIFDGDIVKYKDDSGTSQIGVVTYRAAAFIIIAIGGDEEGNQDHNQFHEDYQKDYLIIGNIYESPELLEVK